MQSNQYNSYPTPIQNGPQRLLNKKTILILAAAFLAFIGFFLLITLTKDKQGGSVTITTDSGAQIMAGTIRDEPLTTIGNTEATYTTEKDTLVYIQVFNDKGVTQTSIELKDGNKTNVTLKITPRSTTSKLFDGAFSDLFIENDVAYGVSSMGRGLENFGITTNTIPEAKFIVKTQVDKILWNDKNNFLYRENRGRIGSFQNGSDTRQDGFAKTATFKGESVPINTIFQNMYRITPGKPVLFVSSDGVFSSNDFGKTLSKIADVNQDNAIIGLFADEEMVYVAYSIYDDDNPGPDGKKEHTHSNDIIIDGIAYNGEKTFTTTVDGQEINGIVRSGNNIHIFTDQKIVMVNGSGAKISELFVHANGMSDVTRIGDRILFINYSGVWALQPDGSAMTLVSFVPQGQAGLPNSIVPASNTTFYYGTRYTTGNRPGATYKITL